jgi:hypothetical protein
MAARCFWLCSTLTICFPTLLLSLQDNPTAYEDARFEVEYIRVYGNKDGALGLPVPSTTAAVSLSVSIFTALLLSLA